MKMRFRAWVLAAGLLASPTLGWASGDYASGNGWTVFAEEEGCSLVMSYEGEVDLYLNYVFGTNSSFLVVLNPAYKSIKEDQEYPIEFTFLRGERTDEGWGEVKMLGVSVNGTPGIGAWLKADELLADFKQSSAIILTRNDGAILVENLDIKGSKSRIAKLEQCSAELHKQNPADPFAG